MFNILIISLMDIGFCPFIGYHFCWVSARLSIEQIMKGRFYIVSDLLISNLTALWWIPSLYDLIL